MSSIRRRSDRVTPVSLPTLDSGPTPATEKSVRRTGHTFSVPNHLVVPSSQPSLPECQKIKRGW